MRSGFCLVGWLKPLYAVGFLSCSWLKPLYAVGFLSSSWLKPLYAVGFLSSSWLKPLYAVGFVSSSWLNRTFVPLIGVRDCPYGICCPWVRGGWDLDALGKLFRRRLRCRRQRRRPLLFRQILVKKKAFLVISHEK